jgi:hypothetical protein
MSVSDLRESSNEHGSAAGLAAAQAERILASEVFRDSPTQQRLFRYIVQESLSGSHRDLKEYNIGVSVFQRGAEFDPRADSIVRVQMGVLRKRLQQYYSGAGSADALVVEVPKGHYVARFLAREARPDVVRHENSPATVPVRPFLYVLAGLLLGAFAMYLSRPKPEAATLTAAGSEAREHPLWRAFLAPGSTSTLVVGAPMFLDLGGAIFVRAPTVNEPEQIASSKVIQQIEAALHTKARPSEIYTGLGEAVGINLLGRFFQAASCDLPLLRNRLTRWQDMTSGNLIFVASLRFHTLNQELNLPSDFQLAKEQEPGIRNLHPRPGERQTYMTSSSPKNGLTDYALISVWPGTLPGRHIMKLGGAYTWGTQGAVEYATDLPSLRKLKTRIEAAPGGWKDDVPLQILLEVQVKEDQVISVKYVTHHWLDF